MDNRLIFTSRRWWREPEAVMLAIVFVGLAVLIAWPRKREQPEPCIQIVKQGNVTHEIHGTLLRDPRGRVICEVVR